jgi:hypothetical protein
MSRRERAWKPGPVVASLLLHGVVVGGLALAGPGEPTKEPKTKVYAVDIVSPPPNMAGAPPLEALSNQEPGPAAQPAPAAEAPAAEAPAPQPAPPAPQPDPEPAPPPREAPKEAPKEPAKAPEPRRTPPEQRPAQPATRPTTPAQRPSPTTRPTPPSSSTTRPTTTPEKGRATPTPEKGRTTTRPTTGSSTTGGTGSGPNRTRGDGTSTAPATGSNPQPNSPGGEGINIHVEGEPCPVAGYCERVTVQVQRYFRPPPETAGARGEVCFRIQRDGSVTDIQTQRVRGGGGAGFRLAMMEAAEAAGSRRAFGTLPAAFDPQRWRWCVELSPR